MARNRQKLPVKSSSVLIQNAIENWFASGVGLPGITAFNRNDIAAATANSVTERRKNCSA